jgi:MFS family permease
VGVAISALAMCLPVAWPHWPTVVVAWTVQGVSTSLVVVSYFTARQELIPAGAIGRAASITRAVAYTALPAGALLGSWVVDRSSSIRAVFGLAAAIESVLLLVGLSASRAPSVLRRPADQG